MTTRSKKSYINAAVHGNGSIPTTPSTKPTGIRVPKISMTPQPSILKNTNQVDRPSSAPAPAPAAHSNGIQNHFPAHPSSQQTQAQASSSVQNHYPAMSQNNPVQQHSQQTSVSRVNRGAHSRSFVATLGPSTGDNAINYGTSDGQKTYKRATSSLKDEYDGTADGITVFRMQLEQKAENEGWSNGMGGDCVHIPRDGIDPSSGLVNIVKERTQVSEDAIRTWAMINVVQQSIDPNMITRKAQNNKNMVETITNTLSKDCLATLGLKDERYTVGGVVIAALFYKVLLEGAELETMVTSANIRAGLQQPELKLAELDHNIKDFADFIRSSLKKLHARGETTNDKDLLLSVFRALKLARDADFRDHFKKEQLMYMSNKRMYDVDSLLFDAETMYSVKIENDDWGKRSKEEEEIIAMKAEFKDLNLKFSEEKKRNKKHRQAAPSASSNRPRKFWLRPGEEWKLENPENKKTQKREGKTWYWCKYHNDGKGMWTLHKPADCRAKKRQDRESSSSSSQQEQAMPAVEESESESESDEESDY